MLVISNSDTRLDVPAFKTTSRESLPVKLLDKATSQSKFIPSSSVTAVSPSTDAKAKFDVNDAVVVDEKESASKSLPL